MPEQHTVDEEILADPRFHDTIERARGTGPMRDPGIQDRVWHALTRGPLATSDTAFDDVWALYRASFAARPAEAGPPAAWVPDEARLRHANVNELADAAGSTDWQDVLAWSQRDRAGFWGTVVERMGIRFHDPPTEVLTVNQERGVEDPVWLPGATMNIVDSCFTADPSSVAILEGREGDGSLRSVSYAELRGMVEQVAAGLRANGFREGDAIALYMPMNVACVAAYLGIVKAGCVAVSIADSFSPKEVATRLDIAGATGAVTVDAFHRGGRTFPLYEKMVEALGHLPEREVRVVVVPSGDDAPAVALREADLSWSRLTEDGASGGDRSSSIGDPQRTTNVLFSSGTTGEPKAIPWTHLTPIKCGMDGRYHQDVHEGDVVAWPTNIGWMMGPWLIYAALLNKATIALYEGAPHTPGFCRFVEAAEVSMLGVVPALVKAWRDKDLTADVDWTRIRTFSSTGEASNAQDYLWLMRQAAWNAPVIEYCGGTEVGGGHITGTVARPAAPATFSTPALGLDFRVLDDEGAVVGPGGHGTLFLVPPSVGLSQRLLNRDHHEEYYSDVPPGPDGERLRRHGDAVAVLHDGYWSAEGRADDTMNLGGIKVSSLELERVMDGDDAVYQSAAVAVPPEGGGADRLVVYVVPRTDAQPSVDELKRALQRRVSAELNPLFRIHDVVLVESLPRTASNKIMRRELRARYRD